jgi:ribose 5-phosphate isomerase A
MAAEFAALAAKALDFVPAGARIGLGSGRTTSAFLHALAVSGRRVRGVATSETSAQLARELGIPLDSLDGEPLDITIDGADEVETSTLHLIKGWGAALVRERIVAAASKMQVIIVGQEKLVDRLGMRGRLPVEVIPFAAEFCRRRLEAVPLVGGIRPSLRLHEGKPLVTDNGNWIIDCKLGPIEDPLTLERALLDIPGVVDTGLFLGTASVVLVEENGTVRELHRNQK